MRHFLKIFPFLPLLQITFCLGDVVTPQETLSTEIDIASPIQSQKITDSKKSFKPFTGKITGNKVRLRLAPSLDGTILRELSAGELCIITGEVDDFYAIKPATSTKGYIFRSYVLDGVVEGSNVNVRTEPDINSIVITQLQQGTPVSGTICAGSTKWLSIDIPETVRFYVAKNYITNIGDETVLTTIQTRRQQVAERFSHIEQSIKEEMSKPFTSIQVLPYVNELKVIISQNQDLSDIVEYAQSLIRTTQEQYLALSQGKQIAQATESNPSQELARNQQIQNMLPPIRYLSFALEQQENEIIEEAIRSGKCVSKEAFYVQDRSNAEELIGQLVPYERPVKNRPGDFMLVHAKTKVPIAYLYSSTVDLNAFSGQIVRLLVSSRPNNHFALPAYFVQELAMTP